VRQQTKNTVVMSYQGHIPSSPIALVYRLDPFYSFHFTLGQRKQTLSSGGIGTVSGQESGSVMMFLSSGEQNIVT
jgi:hypothetical protein